MRAKLNLTGLNLTGTEAIGYPEDNLEALETYSQHVSQGPWWYHSLFHAKHMLLSTDLIKKQKGLPAPWVKISHLMSGN